MLTKDLCRTKAHEVWAIENQEALAERCKLLDAEEGTAAERLYGVLLREKAVFRQSA